MLPQFGITCCLKHKLTKSKLYKEELLGSSTVTLMICIILRQHSQPCWPSWTALSQVLYITLTTLILPSYPFTYPSGSYNYNSIKICKQISTPPQPYQKIPDIYFLRSCSLPNFITIPSPITIQFVVDVFVVYVILYLLLYCLLCYFVLRPQSWINSTTNDRLLPTPRQLGGSRLGLRGVVK